MSKSVAIDNTGHTSPTLHFAGETLPVRLSVIYFVYSIVLKYSHIEAAVSNTQCDVSGSPRNGTG